MSLRVVPRRALVALACLSLPPACASADEANTSGAPAVVEVVDGDTIVVDVTGRRETVRLLGVDTPEVKHPTKPKECFGDEASAFTAALLPPSTPVRLERDTEERDVFGRLLAYVFRPDGMFVNLEIVAQGYGAVLVIAPNHAYGSDLRAAERSAREQGRGLWGTCGRPDLHVE